MTADPHRIRVERDGPQSFTVRCSCGAVKLGAHSKRPFWGKGDALAGVFAHQKEIGREPEVRGVEYVDLAPNRRQRNVA